jgi:hypothetical protein
MESIVGDVPPFDYGDVCHPATQYEIDQFLGEPSTARTVYMVYDRQFPDGQSELCLSKSNRIKHHGSLSAPSRRAVRGESENRELNQQDAATRARQKVRLVCKSISADRMITLTYKENMVDVERLKHDWDTFRRRMSKVKEFHYVAVVERQVRGAFHIHIAVTGRQCYQLVRSIWYRIVGRDSTGKPNGNIDVTNPARFGGQTKTARHRIAAYLSKYISKDMTVREFNDKRYWASRGIVIPERNYYQLPFGTSNWDAVAHFLEILCTRGGLSGALVFQNSALGVWWAATPPS